MVTVAVVMQSVVVLLLPHRCWAVRFPGLLRTHTSFPFLHRFAALAAFAAAACLPSPINLISHSCTPPPL